jgi:hypothetical protein
MGPVKHVLLGSAAGVFAAAGAQAADLPVKAKPVEYVKVCSLYGAGFWYVPGTDTCIKIGAYTKIQPEYNMASTGPFMLGVANNNATDNGGRNTRLDTSPFTFNQRAVASFDMRQQTEYGTLRSYFDVGEQSVGNSSAAQTNLFAAATIFNSRAFIQFAGFTAGRMRSFFDLYFQGNFAFAGQRFGNDTSPNGIVGIAYTWQFGGGVSASFSLEDNGQAFGSRGRSTVNLSAPAFGTPVTVGTSTFGASTLDNKGQEFFDPVINLRLDQAWGFVGASAALHDASGGYYQSGAGIPVEGNGHPGDKFGWAATLGFTLTNVFGLQGDSVAAQGVYSVGAAGYATPNLGTMLAFGSGLNIGGGFLNEGVFVTGSNVELTTVWSFNAAYEHRWDPKWRTSIYGGMIGVQYDDAAKQMWCPRGVINGAAFGGSFTNVTNCDPNWSISEVGSRTMWNPVPDLDVGVDVVWYHLNTAFAGSATIGQNGSKPSGRYTISDQDAVGAVFRIQRNFLY